jgi:hypothetical protein
VSHGLFSTDDLSVGFHCPTTRPALKEEGVAREEHCVQLNTRVWLAPFDLGVKQRMELLFQPAADDPRFLEIRIALLREAGEANAWRRISKAFLDDLRKQLLIWRSLDEEAQSHYGAKLMAAELADAENRAAAGQPEGDSGQETAGS